MSQQCGPCADCVEALKDYATIPGYRRDPLWFENELAAGAFARERTYGYGHPTKPDVHLVVNVDAPTRDDLARHGRKYEWPGLRTVLAKMPADPTDAGLAAVSKIADVTEPARKRSKRRRNIEAEARSLLDRKPA